MFIDTHCHISKEYFESHYEKTDIKVNYRYSNDDNSLEFIFTNKTIPEVLEACSLPNDIKKYVHLTNLEYNNR